MVSSKINKKYRYSYRMNSLSSGTEVSRKPKANRRALEIEYLSLRTIIDNLVTPEPLDIKVEVLSSDGGTRTCALNGVFKLHNEIENTRFYFCAFGVVNNSLLLDMNYEDDSTSEVDVPVGFKIVNQVVVQYCYLQLDGSVTPRMLLQGLGRLESLCLSSK